MTYPNLNEGPGLLNLLKTKTNDYGIEELNVKRKNVIRKKVSKSYEIDMGYRIKNCTKKKEKKIFITVLEITTCVSGLAVGAFLCLTNVRSTVGVPIASCSAFRASVAGLFSNECSLKLIMKFTTVKDGILVIFFGKTLKKSRIEKQKITKRKERNLKS